MKYRLGWQLRGGDEHVEIHDDQESMFQSITDGLQLQKDHWNTAGLTIGWEPPARYCGDGTGHRYEHYVRDTGELECACGARHNADA